MDKRFLKISLVVLFSAICASSHAMAKDQFVKYSDVKDQIAPKPVEVVDPSKISPEELASLQQNGKVTVFDARTKSEFDHEHLAGAKLPRTDEFYGQTELFKQQVVRQAPSSKAGLEAGVKDLPHDAAIVTYCNKHCGLSKSLMLDLQELGFTNVRWLDGGIDVWREKGFPLEKQAT